MSKKDNKKRKFKEFSEKTVKYLDKKCVKESGNAAIFLYKKDGDGVTFVKGNPKSIFTILRESASRDEDFEDMIRLVVDDLDNPGVYKKAFPSENQNKSMFNLSNEEIDKMSPKEMDDYLANFVKNRFGSRN